MVHSTPDERYIARLIDGDSETENHFVSYFGDLLLIKLRSRLRSRPQVDDVRQETLLRVLFALRRKGGLERPDRLGAFVNSTCNHVIQELFRARAHSAPMPENLQERADSAPSPESELISQERLGVVRKVMDELPERDRQVLKHVFFYGTPKDKVCRQLEVDREYLRVLVHRAKNRLREMLQTTRFFGGRIETGMDHPSRGR